VVHAYGKQKVNNIKRPNDFERSEKQKGGRYNQPPFVYAPSAKD